MVDALGEGNHAADMPFRKSLSTLSTSSKVRSTSPRRARRWGGSLGRTWHHVLPRHVQRSDAMPMQPTKAPPCRSAPSAARRGSRPPPQPLARSTRLDTQPDTRRCPFPKSLLSHPVQQKSTGSCRLSTRRAPPASRPPHSHLGAVDGTRTRSVSNSSINCSFISRTLAPANRRYSSNTLVRFHRCSLRRHPTTVPVRWRPG